MRPLQTSACNECDFDIIFHPCKLFSPPADSNSGRLVEKEERAEGSVSWRVYFSYIKALGYWIFVLQLFLLFGKNGVGIATNYWLSAWSEEGNNLTLSNASQVSILSKHSLRLAGVYVCLHSSDSIECIPVSTSKVCECNMMHRCFEPLFRHATLKLFSWFHLFKNRTR